MVVVGIRTSSAMAIVRLLNSSRSPRAPAVRRLDEHSMSLEECGNICQPSSPPPHQHLVCPAISATEAASPSWLRKKGFWVTISSSKKLPLQAPETEKAKLRCVPSQYTSGVSVVFLSASTEQPLCATWQAAVSSVNPHREELQKK